MWAIKVFLARTPSPSAACRAVCRESIRGSPQGPTKGDNVSRAPYDLFIERHKPYRRAVEAQQGAVKARQNALQRMQELERDLAAAESRDLIALGDALAADRRPPPREAEKIRTALEEAKRHSEALAYKEERCNRELDRLPREHKQDWLEQTERDLASAGREYAAAIRQLAETRAVVADLANLASFLRYDGQATQPIREGVVVGRDVNGEDRVVAIEQLIAGLRREVDEVVERTRLDPNRPIPEPRLELMHRR
jgi:hypothetical protein